MPPLVCAPVLGYMRAMPVSDIPYIASHDGTGSTLMLSENLDAMDWIAITANAPMGANDLNAGAAPGSSPRRRGACAIHDPRLFVREQQQCLFLVASDGVECALAIG